MLLPFYGGRGGTVTLEDPILFTETYVRADSPAHKAAKNLLDRQNKAEATEDALAAGMDARRARVEEQSFRDAGMPTAEAEPDAETEEERRRREDERGRGGEAPAGAAPRDGLEDIPDDAAADDMEARLAYERAMGDAPEAPALTLESATAEQIAEERRRAEEREKVREGAARPLGGGKPVNIQPEMDLGQEPSDLFSPVERLSRRPRDLDGQATFDFGEAGAGGGGASPRLDGTWGPEYAGDLFGAAERRAAGQAGEAAGDGDGGDEGEYDVKAALGNRLRPTLARLPRAEAEAKAEGEEESPPPSSRGAVASSPAPLRPAQPPAPIRRGDRVMYRGDGMARAIPVTVRSVDGKSGTAEVAVPLYGGLKMENRAVPLSALRPTGIKTGGLTQEDRRNLRLHANEVNKARRDAEREMNALGDTRAGAAAEAAEDTPDAGVTVLDGADMRRGERGGLGEREDGTGRGRDQYDGGSLEDAGDRYSASITRPWGRGFPHATVATSRPWIKARHAGLFRKAKAGDADAAADLIDAVMADPGRREKVLRLKKDHPRAEIACPVHADEATGRNAIPLAYARYIADANGMEVDDGIVQTVRAGHTGAGKWERLTRRAAFDGPVEEGREYILVDDHITSGGTLNELRSHIENNGGRVVAVACLTASAGGAILKPGKATTDELKRRYPDINRLLRDAGIAGRVEALTAREAGYIKTLSPDTFRDRVAQARQEREAGEAEGEVGAPPSEGVARDSWRYSAALRPALTEGERERLGWAQKEAARVLGEIGGTQAGNWIAREFRETGEATLIGMELRTAGDLAALSQVYRNPCFETLRYVFTKGGRVVWQTGVTCRLPGNATFRARYERGGTLGEITRMAAALGPDTMWIMHNHPSGSVRPSANDVRLTEGMGRTLRLIAPGVRLGGHVIIDHGRYALIGADGSWKSDILLPGRGAAGAPGYGEPVEAGAPDARRLRGAASAAGLAASLVAADGAARQAAAESPGGAVTLVSVNGAARVTAVATVPAGALAAAPDGALLDYGAATAANPLVAVADGRVPMGLGVFKALRRLMRRGVIGDVILRNRAGEWVFAPRAGTGEERAAAARGAKDARARRVAPEGAARYSAAPGYMQDAIYRMDDRDELPSVGSILSEFDRDKAGGRARKYWRTIPAGRYASALRKFMREGELFDYPESTLRDWLDTILGNTMELEHLTALAGHAQAFPADDIEEHYGEEAGGFSDGVDLLDEKGFYDWARLPDGTGAISDYGLGPLYRILGSLPANPTAGEMITAINRALDVAHARGDLPSAFIEGGSGTLAKISGDATPDARYSAAPEGPSGEGRREYEEVAARYTNPDGTRKPGWMMAPNGKRTRLTERQWVQVRTPSFKRWFGDWEALAIQAELENSPAADVAVGAFQKGEKLSVQQTAALLFPNAETYDTAMGEVVIDARSAKNSLGHGYGQKKLDALVTLQRDFRHAVYIGSERDFDGKPIDNHYFAYRIDYGGEPQFVYCRAREDAVSRRLYVHEVYSEDEIKQSNTLQTAARQDRTPHGGVAFGESILQSLYAVKPENVSKVVDGNGEPMVVWHSTDWDLMSESPGKAVFRPSWRGMTFFATSSDGARRAAAEGNDKTFGFFLNARNIRGAGGLACTLAMRNQRSIKRESAPPDMTR